MKRFLQHLSFIYVVSFIAIVGSERMFWYWATNPLAHIEGALWYSLSTSGFIAVMRRFEVHSIWGLIMALPIFAYITEGFITPVLYSGGPTPFFPLWFTGWHGFGSLFILVFGVRLLAIERRPVAMGLLGASIGVFTGTWLITSKLESNLNDPELLEEHGELVVLHPVEFMVYVSMVTGFLVLGHLGLNYVWPKEPQRLFARTEKPLAGVILAGVVGWTFVIPWALPMFVGLCWLQFRLLSRHRSQRLNGQRTVLELFGQPASLVALAPLTIMAPVAGVVYLIWWAIAPTETILASVYYGTIAVQTVVAAVAVVVAWRRIRRHSIRR